MLPYILAAVGGYLIGDSLKRKQYADGGMMGSGETYFKQQAELKGGIDYFSVDIDTEDGEQIRDLKYKSYQSAKKVYDKYKKSMQYKGSSIDDIQLIVGYKNGDYDSIGGMAYADGRMMAKGGRVYTDEEIYEMIHEEKPPKGFRLSKEDYTIAVQSGMMYDSDKDGWVTMKTWNESPYADDDDE